MCGMANQTPPGYSYGVGADGRPRDAASRPELVSGTVDFLVPNDYCVRPLQKPIHVFCIDVSERAREANLVRASLDAVAAALERGLPGGAQAQVAVVAYDARTFFFSFKSDDDGSAEPLMYV
jgi:hypothetical protein